MSDRNKLAIAEAILEALGELPMEEFFTEEELHEWATENGYIKAMGD